jgi:hypothetical protein
VLGKLLVPSLAKNLTRRLTMEFGPALMSSELLCLQMKKSREAYLLNPHASAVSPKFSHASNSLVLVVQKTRLLPSTNSSQSTETWPGNAPIATCQSAVRVKRRWRRLEVAGSIKVLEVVEAKV